MATFNIFDNITLLGGVRFESYNMNYNAQYTYISHNVDGDAISTRVGTIADIPDGTPGLDTLYHSVPYSANHVNRTDNNVFPDVQLKFKTTEWSDIRLAYTTGISRPDYASIIPKVAIDPTGRSITMGNPKLRPTKVQNIDLILSVFSNKVGLFTINGFYKELKDVIYGTTVFYDQISKFANEISIPDSAFLQNHFGYQFAKTDNVNVTINNNNKAYIRGVEIDWQTNFWYLPEPFNSIVLDVNYTKSASHLDYLNLRSLQVKDGKLPNGHPKYKDSTEVTVYSGRLIQQANDVINASIGIDYKGFSGRLSFNMRGNVLNYVNVRPEQTSYTGNIYNWSFSIKQSLPIDGLSLSLNGTNIFHNAIRSYQDYKLKPDQQTTTNGVTTTIPTPVTKNLMSVLYAPTVFQLNIRYSF
jgi:TonB-dependent receptor